MAKNYTPVASYPSKSNPSVTHTVHVDENGELSCTCPGWCKHPPPRTCVHVRQEELNRQLKQGYWSGDPQYVPVVAPAQEVQARPREKGGSLSDLFAKLDKMDKGE